MSTPPRHTCLRGPVMFVTAALARPANGVDFVG